MKKQILFSSYEEYSADEKKRLVEEIWSTLEMYVLDAERNTGCSTYKEEQYKSCTIDTTHYFVDIKITADRSRRDKEYLLTAVIPIWDFIAASSYDFTRFNLPDWVQDYGITNFGTIVGCRHVRFPLDNFDEERRLIQKIAVIILPMNPFTINNLLVFNQNGEINSEKDESFKKMLGGNCGIITPWDYKTGHVEHWLRIPNRKL